MPLLSACVIWYCYVLVNSPYFEKYVQRKWNHLDLTVLVLHTPWYAVIGSTSWHCFVLFTIASYSHIWKHKQSVTSIVKYRYFCCCSLKIDFQSSALSFTGFISLNIQDKNHGNSKQILHSIANIQWTWESTNYNMVTCKIHEWKVSKSRIELKRVIV